MKGRKSHKAATPVPAATPEEQGIPLADAKGLKQPDTLIALHRARFFDWAPTAVTAIAVTSDGTVLAAARESGSIEIWHTDHWTHAVVRPSLATAAHV